MIHFRRTYHRAFKSNFLYSLHTLYAQSTVTPLVDVVFPQLLALHEPQLTVTDLRHNLTQSECTIDKVCSRFRLLTTTPHYSQLSMGSISVPLWQITLPELLEVFA